MERKGYIYLNEVKITGRLTDEVNYTRFEGEKNGSVAEFTIAHNRRWKPKEGEDWRESTSFFRVKAYNGLAEKVKEKLGREILSSLRGDFKRKVGKTKKGKREV